MTVPLKISLDKLNATQERVAELAHDPSYVHPFTPEQLAIIGWALGCLAGERLVESSRPPDIEQKSVPICIACWRKLKGPDREPGRLNDEGMALCNHSRHSPCHFCERSTEHVPGIFIRAWVPTEPKRDRWWER
jgi:hypothetical protein